MSRQRDRKAASRNLFVERLRAPQIAPPWAIRDVIFALAALLLTMTLVASTVAAIVSGGALQPTSLLLGWGIGLTLTAAYIALAWRRSAEFVAALKLAASDLPLPLVGLFGIAAALTFTVIAAMGTIGDFRSIPILTGIGTGGGADWVLALLIVGLLQPVTESLVFFGIALPRLRASLGSMNGALTTAVIFGAYHLLIFGASIVDGGAVVWYGTVVPALLGFFLAIMRLRTASTRATIIAYAAYNITMIIIAITLSP